MLAYQGISFVNSKIKSSRFIRSSSYIKVLVKPNESHKKKVLTINDHSSVLRPFYTNQFFKLTSPFLQKLRTISETSLQLNGHMYALDQELDYEESFHTQHESTDFIIEEKSFPSTIKKDFYLLNYVQACVNAGLWNEAIDVVMERNPLLLQDLQCVEYLLQMLVGLPKSESDLPDVPQSIIGLFQKILLSNLTPTPNTCACVLAAMHKYDVSEELVGSILAKVEEVHSIASCLESCHPQSETKVFLTPLLESLRPEALRLSKERIEGKVPPVIADLYKHPPSNSSIQHSDWLMPSHVTELYQRQLAMETEGTVSIPNVLSRPEDEARNRSRDTLHVLHRNWAATALKTLRLVKDRERKKLRTKRSKNLCVYPFLCLLPDKDYVDIIINHISQLPKSGDPTLNTVFSIGNKVFSRYALKQFLTESSSARLHNLYRRYLKLYTDGNSNSVPREYWESLEKKLGCMRSEGLIRPWQSIWRVMVGKKLLEIMVSTFAVEIGGRDQVPSAYFKDIPAVYNSYRPWGNRICGMTVPHPVYYNLVQAAKSDFNFEADMLPMVVPPLPWISQDQGAFLCRPSEFIRKGATSPIPSKKLGAVFDALNVQSSVAWKINQRVLDVQLQIFREDGDPDLKIAPPPPIVPLELRFNRQCPPEKRREQVGNYHRARKRSNEMNSLHADALYKFSIANHFRDKLIWLPHNLDFRGRSYPIPPHFNYMGDDVNRSLFMFADGKPLGKEGLRWLKIHIVNLTGTKKSEDLQTRLECAEQMLDDIIDSAELPLSGRGWWKTSEEPWQTLAACMELTDALKCSDPESFVSHLPIHQDGSCNGLQHYAALGRDEVGAKQVNLAPSTDPHDVYVGVAQLVEELRIKDAEAGVKIAQDLEGFISRKVVKQTVMTTVYGVTRYGGALQVKKKLVAFDSFPSEKRLQASIYIVRCIFQSISSMFTSAVNIQRWLTDIATCISRGGRSVEWTTVLGLLSIQPYYKQTLTPVDSPLHRIHFNTPTSTPNVMKQCNAFPPNFVHSLDSVHMMLTALHCFHSGVKFSAIHDCYWSHASTVHQMNEICREQFIALHEQPILENLAHHLQRFLPGSGDGGPEEWIAEPQRERLRELLSNIPTRGNFNLNDVKNSIFFFS